MKKLWIAGLMIFGVCGISRAEKLDAQFRTWKSSQLQCGNYSNVLISSTPIIFHVVNGSPTVLSNGSNNTFTFFWSTAQPPTSDMSTKAAINMNVNALGERSNLGDEWNVVVTTTFGYRIYSYYSKIGGACPIFYLWDYYNFAPQVPSNLYFEKN